MSKIHDVIQSVQDETKSEAPLCTMKSARFKAFIQLIRQITKLNGPLPIRISDSRICQAIGHDNYVVDIDLSNFFDSNAPIKDSVPYKGINFTLQPSGSDLKRLSGLFGDHVQVYDNGDALIFTTFRTQEQLYQPKTLIPHLISPSIPESKRIGEEVTSQDLALATLKNYVPRNEIVFLCCYDGQLEQVKVQGKNPYTFHPTALAALKGRESDKIFISQHFLALAGKLELSLGIYANARGYWLKTSSRNNMVKRLTTWELLCEGTV